MLNTIYFSFNGDISFQVGIRITKQIGTFGLVSEPYRLLQWFIESIPKQEKQDLIANSQNITLNRNFSLLMVFWIDQQVGKIYGN